VLNPPGHHQQPVSPESWQGDNAEGVLHAAVDMPHCALLTFYVLDFDSSERRFTIERDGAAIVDFDCPFDQGAYITLPQNASRAVYVLRRTDGSGRSVVLSGVFFDNFTTNRAGFIRGCEADGAFSGAASHQQQPTATHAASNGTLADGVGEDEDGAGRTLLIATVIGAGWAAIVVMVAFTVLLIKRRRERRAAAKKKEKADAERHEQAMAARVEADAAAAGGGVVEKGALVVGRRGRGGAVDFGLSPSDHSVHARGQQAAPPAAQCSPPGLAGGQQGPHTPWDADSAATTTSHDEGRKADGPVAASALGQRVPRQEDEDPTRCFPDGVGGSAGDDRLRSDDGGVSVFSTAANSDTGGNKDDFRDSRPSGAAPLPLPPSAAA
jgi:hypothetical protein